MALRHARVQRQGDQLVGRPLRGGKPGGREVPVERMAVDGGIVHRGADALIAQILDDRVAKDRRHAHLIEVQSVALTRGSASGRAMVRTAGIEPSAAS